MIENCPMRHENGNCIPAGGFCTANKNICEALLNAYRMGKEQLSKEITTSDLISKTETVEHLRRVLDVTVPITDYDSGYVDGVEFGVSTVSTMPTIQPERKKGEWLPDNNNAYEMRFVCSCCKESEVVPTIGFTKYRPLWDFCPNCGADMRGEKDG